MNNEQKQYIAPYQRTYFSLINVLFFIVLILGICVSEQKAPAAVIGSIEWTDANISSETKTRVRAGHIQEMRDRINAKRITAGMPVFNFTDPALTPNVTAISAIHFLQLEQAVQQFYENDPLWHNWFITNFHIKFYEINPHVSMPGGDTGGSNPGPLNKTIKSNHIKNLREAIEAAGFCGDGICQPDPTGPEDAGLCDIDCNTACTTATTAYCGPTPCGTIHCESSEKCQATTCFNSTTYACVVDPVCGITSCPAQVYTTASCGDVNFFSTAVGFSTSASCPTGCSGNVTATCYATGILISFNDTCTPTSSCSDGIQNGTETGIDCGGSCPALACANCPATTYVDPFCGGMAIPASNHGETITGDFCSEACRSLSNVRITCSNGSYGGIVVECLTTCADGVQNGTETGVDCGGSCTACTTCMGEIITISGTSADETLTGTNGPDVIDGSSGHDIINGLGGDDIICGSSGNDTISGGDGNDTISDSSGNDNISGDQGNDQITDVSGDDTISGNDGDDTIDAGSGTDVCDGGTGTNILTNCECSIDGIQNGTETGIDCGGTCPACLSCTANGTYTFTDPACDVILSSGFPHKTSLTASDTNTIRTHSLTLVCENGTAYEVHRGCVLSPTETCSDDVRNGSEIGVDCGGLACPPCNDCTFPAGFTWGTGCSISSPVVGSQGIGTTISDTTNPKTGSYSAYCNNGTWINYYSTCN